MSLPFGEIYYKIISLDLSTNISNYQIKLTLTTSNFNYSNVKNDGGDIRFVTMSDISLNYFIEDWNTSGNSNIWVKIPDSGTTQIKMLYGNNSLSSLSNPDNVFNFYDTFTGTSIDTSKWIIDDGTGFDVSNSLLKGTDTKGKLRSQNTFSEPLIYETKHYVVEDPANGYSMAGIRASTSDGITVLNHETDQDYINRNGSWTSMNDVILNGTTYIIKFTSNSGNVNVLLTDYSGGSTIYNQTFTNTISNERITIGIRPDDLIIDSGQAYEGYWDWMRVRQFMSTEPTASISAEQQEAGGFGDPIIRPVFGNIYYLPNDESIYLLLKNDNLEIYTKNWIPLKNKMSFMKYFIIRFNCEQFCLDLDNFKFVKFDMQKINNCDAEYINYIPNISNLRIETKNLHKNIKDFSTGKNFKITKSGKQIQLYFKLENYEIVLQVITDLSYKDIRNTSFIKFIGNITTNDIMNMSGAFIQESKCKKIRDNKLKINKIYA